MDKDNFKNYMKKIDVELSDVQCEQLDSYHKILVEWNEFMNLTGITEYEEVQIKHFADSLALAYAVNNVNEAKASEYKDIKKEIDFTSSMSIIDVGTGAGFPGLPLKIAYPDTKVVLLDSLNKRIKFLNEVIMQLGLTGIEAVHSRAEDGARNVEYREKFTISVSRAVANLATLTEYCLPFVKIGGYFVAYKSGEIDEELEKSKKAVSILGGRIETVYKFRLPDTDIDRSIIFIKKVKSTSKKYPRKSGLPSKEPL